MKGLIVLVVAGLLPLLAAERPAGVLKAASSGGTRGVVTDTRRDAIIPYVYDGNGWRTSFVFTNLENHSVQIHLEFSLNDGSDWRVPVDGIGPTTAVDVTLGVGGSFVLNTSGIDSNRTAGYSFVQPTNHTDRFGVYAVVRNVISGLPDLEVTEPLSPIDENFFTIAFDNTNGYSTSVALVNSSSQNTANVNVTVQDQNGNSLATDQIAIGIFGRFTFNVADRYPQLANAVGSLNFSASGGQYVTGAALRAGPNQSITYLPAYSLPLQ